MQVAVVILNWNGRSFLQQFLPFVIKHSSSIAEIIIADNASTDDSIAFLKSNYPQVTVIENHLNLGFAGGYNHALKRINADYFLLLNSDVEVTPSWIEPMLTMMENNKSIAACQPKILSYHRRDEFEFAGAAGGFIDRLGYPFCRGRIMQTLEKDKGQYDDARKIFWATGACMLVRASAFNEVGGFDEMFFAHQEEIDLCWRMQLAGYSIYYCPTSTIYHIGGGTLPKKNSHKTYLNFRNNRMLLYKNIDESQYRKIWFQRIILDIVAAIRFIFAPNGIRESTAVLKALWDFHKMKRKLVKTVSRRRANDFNNLIYHKSIIGDYYLRGKKNFSELDW